MDLAKVTLEERNWQNGSCLAEKGGWGFGKHKGTNASNSASKIRVGYRGGKKKCSSQFKTSNLESHVYCDYSPPELHSKKKKRGTQLQNEEGHIQFIMDGNYINI